MDPIGPKIYIFQIKRNSTKYFSSCLFLSFCFLFIFIAKATILSISVTYTCVLAIFAIYVPRFFSPSAYELISTFACRMFMREAFTEVTYCLRSTDKFILAMEYFRKKNSLVSKRNTMHKTKYILYYIEYRNQSSLLQNRLYVC